MDRYKVQATVFDSIFGLFKELIKKNSNEEFIDFYHGLPDVWEKYKIPIANLAYERLKIDTWTEKDIGGGKILDFVISAIEIQSKDTGLVNNLVHWIPKQGRPKEHLRLLQVKETRENLEEYENLFYNFYKNKISPENAMAEFIRLLGKKYPLIAYFFFVKNPHQYLPIAPQYFDNVFEYLDIDFRASRKCSWENYNNYLDIIDQIKNYLLLKDIRDIRLIDAHSFCWIVANLTNDDSISRDKFINVKKSIPKPVFHLATEINSGEGPNWEKEEKSYRKRDKEYYENKYDRDLFIGRKAEDLVISYEIDKLNRIGLSDKAKEVKQVSDIPELGYDIDSFDENGNPICIEVKAVRINVNDLSFFLTDNEFKTGKSKNNYYYYLVSFKNPNKPAIVGFHSNLLKENYLKPVNYLVFLRKN